MKQPLVLIPGLLCDAALWGPQVAALGDIADVWIPDLRTQSSIREMAEAVLREAPFQRFALAGLSMGGYVAMEIMRRAARRVPRLALLDTRATPDTPEETGRRLELIRLARTERGFTPVTSRMLPLLVHPSRVGDASLVRIIRDMAERTGIDAFVRQQAAIIHRPDSRPDLKAIGCPTLVLCGREDAITALASHEEMARLIPGARLHVVEVCGHLSTLERPEQVNRALRDWLTGSGRKTPVGER
ncbi:MAG TPA: alpha/beta fold hydrolase [Burkholderiales bacterium]|nr:alpha/beta fold hydrolase [Burkholderiales bacterium]